MDNNNSMNYNQGGEVRPGGNYQEFPDGTRRMVRFTSPPQPSFDNEEMRGSMQQLLGQNVGEYVCPLYTYRCV